MGVGGRGAHVVVHGTLWLEWVYLEHSDVSDPALLPQEVGHSYWMVDVGSLVRVLAPLVAMFERCKLHSLQQTPHQTLFRYSHRTTRTNLLN